MLLAVRHGSVRLTAGAAASVIAVGLISGGGGAPVSGMSWATIVAGSLAAVAGSRLMAPGPAVAAAWRSGSAWWLPAGGRLLGAAILLAPTVAVTVAALSGRAPDWHVALAACAVWVYATAVASVAMALAPMLGSSVSGAVALLGVWFGGIPPSGMYEAFSTWTYVQRPLVLMWNVLPLGWRAGRWIEQGPVPDGFVIGSWILLGVGVAAWGAVSGPLVEGQRMAS